MGFPLLKSKYASTCQHDVLGLPSWGIAWYINGLLIPVLHLKRGVSYTFRVAGGNNTSSPSKYHPFYITNSVVGGYEQVSVIKLYVHSC